MNSLILISQILLIVYTMPRFASSLDNCQHAIVESMPEKMRFNNSLSFKTKPTHESLIQMVNDAKKSIVIVSFYLTLTPEPEFADHPSAEPGKMLLEAILEATNRGVSLEVILDRSSMHSMNNQDDVKKLHQVGTVRYLNMTKLQNSGILHTKFMIADNSSIYIGSSNFDWRSYTQIKEIGIEFLNCPLLAADLRKIYKTYKYMSMVDHIPDELPRDLKTKINIRNPITLKTESKPMKLFLASSPPGFNGYKVKNGRTDDIVGLLNIINRAEKRIDISVMNYSPTTEFLRPRKFWPEIDNALRRAASERRVKVRLLFSNWSHAKPEELMWYRSLNAVQSDSLGGGGIQVKMFKVPIMDNFEGKIPYARVKHDKFMVTDNGLYIGTSNWSADYFINTCGVSVNISPGDQGMPHIIEQMQELFERDFTSEFSNEINQVCPKRK